MLIALAARMSGFSGRNSILTLVAVLAAALLCSCAPEQNVERYKGALANCDPPVPYDQMDSLLAGKRSFPISLTIDSQMDPSELAAVQEATEMWNRVAEGKPFKAFFNLQIGQVPAHLRNAPQDHPRMGGQAYLIRSKKAGTRTPGMTYFTIMGDRVESQVMVMEASDEQFKTAVLHELGHAISLDHSCMKEGGHERYRSCQGLESDLSHPYRKAVMFPHLYEGNFVRNGALYFGQEVKELLHHNDTLRASCVANH